MEKFGLKSFLAGAALVGMALSGVATAATDGQLGTTSTGNLNVTLGVPDMVKITDLDDINLGTFSGANMTGADDVCVYHNGAATYNVTISGTGAGGAFALKDASGLNTIPFSVTYGDGSSVQVATPSVVLTNRQNASTTSVSCNSGTNATLSVNVLAVDAAASPVGTYNETVTLLVAPF